MAAVSRRKLVRKKRCDELRLLEPIVESWMFFGFFDRLGPGFVEQVMSWIPIANYTAPFVYPSPLLPQPSATRFKDFLPEPVLSKICRVFDIVSNDVSHIKTGAIEVKLHVSGGSILRDGEIVRPGGRVVVGVEPMIATVDLASQLTWMYVHDPSTSRHDQVQTVFEMLKLRMRAGVADSVIRGIAGCCHPSISSDIVTAEDMFIRTTDPRVGYVHIYEDLVMSASLSIVTAVETYIGRSLTAHQELVQFYKYHYGSYPASDSWDYSIMPTRWVCGHMGRGIFTCTSVWRGLLEGMERDLFMLHTPGYRPTDTSLPEGTETRMMRANAHRYGPDPYELRHSHSRAPVRYVHHRLTHDVKVGRDGEPMDPLMVFADVNYPRHSWGEYVEFCCEAFSHFRSEIDSTMMYVICPPGGGKTTAAETWNNTRPFRKKTNGEFPNTKIIRLVDIDDLPTPGQRQYLVTLIATAQGSKDWRPVNAFWRDQIKRRFVSDRDKNGRVLANREAILLVHNVDQIPPDMRSVKIWEVEVTSAMASVSLRSRVGVQKKLTRATTSKDGTHEAAWNGFWLMLKNPMFWFTQDEVSAFAIKFKLIDGKGLTIRGPYGQISDPQPYLWFLSDMIRTGLQHVPRCDAVLRTVEQMLNRDRRYESVRFPN